MLTKNSTKDKRIKDNCKKSNVYKKKLKRYMDVMSIPGAISIVRAMPEYHVWPNTKGSKEEIHSLPLSGNWRLLFAYDKDTELFYHLRLENPH